MSNHSHPPTIYLYPIPPTPIHPLKNVHSLPRTQNMPCFHRPLPTSTHPRKNVNPPPPTQNIPPFTHKKCPPMLTHSKHTSTHPYSPIRKCPPTSTHLKYISTQPHPPPPTPRKNSTHPDLPKKYPRKPHPPPPTQQKGPLTPLTQNIPLKPQVLRR